MYFETARIFDFAPDEGVSANASGAEFDGTGWLEVGTDAATFDGHNLLALRFANVVDPAADVSDVVVRDSLRIAQRKMQVAYGWDISCYLLTVGVWQPIELRRERLATLGPATFSTIHLDADGACAVVQIGARIDAFAMDGAGVGAVHYRLIASDGTVAAQGELGINGCGNRASAYAIVEKPMLWWTRDLGTPHLYRLQLSLSIGADVVDTNETSVGIRTLTLDQSPDQAEPPNRFFRFVLNGHPIFARGANWVPNDLRLGVLKALRLRTRGRRSGAPPHLPLSANSTRNRRLISPC